MHNLLIDRLSTIAACAIISVVVMFGLGYLHTEHEAVPALGYMPILVTLLLAEAVINFITPQREVKIRVADK